MALIAKIKGPDGVRVELLDDPHTPSMVYLNANIDGRHVEFSATFQCAMDQGAVEDVELTPAACRFLSSVEDRANDHYDRYTHNNPDNK